MTWRCPECGSHEVSVFVDATVEMDTHEWNTEDFIRALKYRSEIPFHPESLHPTLLYGRFKALLCRDCGEETEWIQMTKAEQQALMKEWSEKED